MYDILNLKITNELYLLRQGWFSPKYELTDKVNNYGKITIRRTMMYKTAAITAINTWIFQRKSFFSRSIFINDENGIAIGTATTEWFNRKTKLTLESGFCAEFYRPSFFSREYIWESDGYGKVMHIKSNPFRLTNTIYIDRSSTPASLIPLLIFLGFYLVFLKRRRKAIVLETVLAFSPQNFSGSQVANTGTLYQ
ncbi:MAG TPA: hypothetical protein VGI43_13595 [Mucilaginibacter sp.]|jgi:hypothetical protein